MSSTLNDRQKHVLNQLNHAGEVKVQDLKERYDVTEMTIRRDLEKLEQLGLAKRTFGGAILASRDKTFYQRSALMSEEKEQIGKYCVSLVQKNDSIFLDGGTTTLQIARFLPEDFPITVVTNAINIVQELAEKKISTIVVGGILVEETKSMVGPIAVETITRLAFDKVFLGTSGIHMEHGFSNSNMYEAEIKRMAIERSRESYVVSDHTKFGEKALFSFASFDQIRKIVTDQMPSFEYRSTLQKAGVDIMSVK